MQKFLVVLFTCIQLFLCTQSFANEQKQQGESLNLLDLFELIGKLSCDQVLSGISDAAKNIKNNTLDNPAVLHQRRLIETYAIVSRCGLNQVSMRELMNAQLSGMVNSLKDPHSEFLDNDNFKEENDKYRGVFVGVGVDLEPIIQNEKFHGVRVVRPLPRSSAEEAGILPNDEITEISEEGILAYRVSSFVDFRTFMSKINGEEGSTVVFTIIRKGTSSPLRIRLIRTQMHISHVHGEVLPSGWLWIRVSQFTGNNFCDDLSKMQGMLRQKVGKNFRGTILDLQNNLGGGLDHALCTVSLYARDAHKSKPVIFLEDRNGVHDLGPLSYITKPGNLTGGKPLIILVNPHSASASEIVAKALQYYGAAEIIGTPTYGKGSVQDVITLSDGKVGVKLTTAQYLIGSRERLVAVQKIGVIPNILMKNPADENKKFFCERDLSGSINTSIIAKSELVILTKNKNPQLYSEVVRVLMSKPFEFTLE